MAADIDVKWPQKYKYSNFSDLQIQIMYELTLSSGNSEQYIGYWGRILNPVRPFYERAVSNLDRSMHGSL